MKIERISAFSVNGTGGNPAGVAIGGALPDAAEMARRIGVRYDVVSIEPIFS